MEVVSPSGLRNGYETKDRLYARAGIPVYLVFDPYETHCVMHWNPGQDGYLGRDTVPYGKTVSIETPSGGWSWGRTNCPLTRETSPGNPLTAERRPPVQCQEGRSADDTARAGEVTKAARTPPVRPKRWPCQETPLPAGRTPHRIEP